MATFADNSVANFFFHSPWRPKWSQLGALHKLMKTKLKKCHKKLHIPGLKKILGLWPVMLTGQSNFSSVTSHF